MRSVAVGDQVRARAFGMRRPGADHRKPLYAYGYVWSVYGDDVRVLWFQYCKVKPLSSYDEVGFD